MQNLESRLCRLSAASRDFFLTIQAVGSHGARHGARGALGLLLRDRWQRKRDARIVPLWSC